MVNRERQSVYALRRRATALAGATRAGVAAGLRAVRGLRGFLGFSGIGMRVSAVINTSSMLLACTSVMSRSTFFGTSSRSFAFFFGMTSVRMPARCADSSFSLQTANRQHAPAQRDLAGHRHIAPRRNLGQRGDQRGRHRDAGARAFLADRAFGHVDVNVVLFEGAARNAQLHWRASAHSSARPWRFPASLRPVGRSASNRHCLPSASLRSASGRRRPRPRHAIRHAHLILLVHLAPIELRRPKILGQHRRRDAPAQTLAFSATLRAALRHTLAISRSRLRTPAS